MKRALDVIRLAAIVLLCAVLIGYGILYFTKGIGVSNKAGRTATEQINDLDYNDLKRVDNCRITGAKTLALIKEYYKSIPIMISTGICPAGFYDLTNIRCASSQYYLNTGEKFHVKITYDGENTISIVQFSQDGVAFPVADLDAAAEVMASVSLDDRIVDLQASEFETRQDINALTKSLAPLEAKVAVASGATPSTAYWESLTAPINNRLAALKEKIVQAVSVQLQKGD